MTYIVGLVSTLQSLSALVNEAMGYPVWGRRADTDEVIMPQPDQPISQVEGVTLGYAQVYPSSIQLGLGYYIRDEGNDAAVGALLSDLRFLALTETATRDFNLFPEYV